ncbi:nuclease-related domain-containing protein [Spirillospora sp. NPDC029432]|uniref:nuclease-related domain-containing protein n=1 Tax=Spirillospora sp. NPDC029432 TaxID=3154599 RepID=UPI00345598DF
MFGSSIYLRGRDAFTGGSPQAVYEELWQRGRKSRLRTRAILAALTLLSCSALVNAVFGVVAALLVAAADTYFHWHGYNASSVWRRGLRGEERMGRLLRHTLERRGHRVLHSRVVPGHGELDQLVVGPGGLWLLRNDAWHPETEIGAHGGQLFVDGRTKSAMVRELVETAATAGALIAERAQIEVKVVPVLVVHGGKLRKAPFRADGITFAPPLKTVRWILRNPVADYSDDDVETIARAAVHALPIGGRTMTAA